MVLIDRYILRAVLTPLLLALSVAAMLLLLEQMLRLFDFVLAEQGPVDVVWRMLANLVPHYLGLALPLGTFLGIMLAFRNLALSSELDAISSSGMSFARMLRPVYVLILALIVLDFLLVAYIQPYGSYKYKQIRFDVTSGAFGIRIQPGEFIDLSDEVTIRFGEIDGITRQASDIFLEQALENGELRTTTAKRGTLSASPDLTVLNLELEDGLNVIISPDGSRIQTLQYPKTRISLDLPSAKVFRLRGENAKEATFGEILKVVREGRVVHPEIYDEFRASLHWRLMQPITFLVLPILAVAMGVTGRRRTSNLKPIIGIIVLIAYHEVVEEWGQVMVEQGRASPYLTIWGILAIFAAISFYLYNNSIDKARNARLVSRLQNNPIRLPAAVRVEPRLSEALPPVTPPTSPVSKADPAPKSRLAGGMSREDRP